MIDLHSHSIFSDGELIPSELARRAEARGLSVIGITDHGDLSNLDFIIPRIVAVAKQLNPVLSIRIIPGIEITHVPPGLIKDTVTKARDLGASIVIVHGETIAEPVAPGTNAAAIAAGADILAHPGLISEEDVMAARDGGVLLEITARKGHSLTNGHVARLAQQCGAKLVINTDSHGPGDLIDAGIAERIVRGAGLDRSVFVDMQRNAALLIEKKR
ncbi:MAG: histidinol phosphate phosphatase domain-containing protein [Desulfobacteraceae bacterium]|jgi:histidinol phosphatase-like PHP family hydrolase|nr:MAG: histidinol phosphate phosphatase domain-containing protein [Desulfobacteraceae bacterium]